MRSLFMTSGGQLTHNWCNYPIYPLVIPRSKPRRVTAGKRWGGGGIAIVPQGVEVC